MAKSFSLISSYLLLYNLTAAAGWAWLLLASVKNIAAGANFGLLWQETESMLKIVQTMACLEIIHSAVGFVKSPVFTTFMQVFSRVWTLWAVMDIAPEAQTSVFFMLAVTSWSLVEVPRYLFYALDSVHLCPKALKWLRYSLFAVLYPTGITGELGCMYHAGLNLYKKDRFRFIPIKALPQFEISLLILIILVALTYIPGSPKMYMHMVKARSKALYGDKKKKT